MGALWPVEEVLPVARRDANESTEGMKEDTVTAAEDSSSMVLLAVGSGFAGAGERRTSESMRLASHMEPSCTRSVTGLLTPSAKAHETTQSAPCHTSAGRQARRRTRARSHPPLTRYSA